MKLIRWAASAGCVALWGCGTASAGGNGGFPADEAARRRAASPVTEAWASGPEAEFTSISHLDVDSRGNVYVPDFYQHRVVVLGPDGRLARTLGRRGGGPGEFRAVSTVQVLPGDSLLVYDGDLGRINVFAPDSARPAYAVNVRGSAPWSLHRTRAGDAFVARYESGFRFGEGSNPRPRQDRIRVLNLDGSRRGDVLAFPARSFLVAQQSVTPNPWGHNGFARLDPRGRLVFAWSDTLGVAIHDLQGRRTGGFRAAYTPPALTRADLRHEVDALPDVVRAQFAPVLEDSLPERWPAVRGLLVDDQDRVWLELAGSRRRETEWAAFSADGAYRGSILVPAGSSIHLIRGGTAYGAREDADEVPHAVQYRIVRPPR